MKYLFTSLLCLLSMQIISAANQTILTVNVDDCNGINATGLVKVYSGNAIVGEDQLNNGSAQFVLNTSSSISTLENQKKVSVYPNPVIGEEVYLFFDADYNNGVLRFYGVDGKLLGQANSDANAPVLLSNLQGVILYEYTDESGAVESGKIVTYNDKVRAYVSFNKEYSHPSSSLKSMAAETYTVVYEGDLMIEEEVNVALGQSGIVNLDACISCNSIYSAIGSDQMPNDWMRSGTNNDHSVGGSNDYAVSWFGGNGSEEKHFLLNFNNTNLAEGEALKLTMEYTIGFLDGTGLNTNNSTLNAIRVGLFNNNGVTVNDGSGVTNNSFANYTGYYGGISVKSSNTPRIFERSIGQNSLILGSAGTRIGQGVQTGNMADAERRTIVFTIEKTVNGHEISFSQEGLTGVFNFNTLDNSPSTNSFNTFALGLDDNPELMDWIYIYSVDVEKCIIGDDGGNQTTQYRLNVTGGSSSGFYDEGSSVTVNAYAAPTGQSFDRWIGDVQGIADPTNTTITLIMNADRNIQAQYKDDPKPQYILNVTGGTVNIGTNGGLYDEGTVVQVTANAAPTGQEFDRWIGNTSGITVTNPSVAVAMNFDRTLTATYKDIPKPQYRLTVNGGSVNIGTNGGLYDEGTVVQVAANAAPVGQEFDRWTGSTAGIIVTNPSISVTVNADKTLTATYKNVSSGAKVTLPIEVMGSARTTETITVNLGNKGSQASKLWLKVHNLSYNGKMRVRVNGNSWINVSNSNGAVTVQQPERSYGGIGGGFSTIRVVLDFPNSNFINNDNTIEFEFNRGNDPSIGMPLSIGYRVVSMNVQDDNNNNLIDWSEFVLENPATWTAPQGGDASIGLDLWLNEQLKDGNGTNINAKCADCHTVDGRDLKYFNYSNKTIITRAKFHGLTEQKGKHIAAYIRGIDMPAPPADARPWNPPYQPGPGTDSKSAFAWAAGAGLDAVLGNDRDMLQQMFGSSNPSVAQIDAVVDTRKNLNVREIGIAVQLPDWNHWLPRIHPKDLFGENYWNNSAANQAYVKLNRFFTFDNAANSNWLINWTEEYHSDIMWWINEGGNSPHPWTHTAGTHINRAKGRGYTSERAKLNLTLWQAVKLFEMMNKYGGQAQAKRIRGAAEKWQWPSNWFSVFQAAAHFIGDDRGTSAFKYESQVVGTYWSSVWYELQMILSPGMRSGYAVEPVDWAYNHQHVNLIAKRSGTNEPMRLIRNILKSWQQRDKSGGIRTETWSMREVSPWRLFCNHAGEEFNHAAFNTYASGLRGKITSSFVSEFVRKSNASYPNTNNWPRTNPAYNTWYQIEPTNYNPRGQVNPFSEGARHYIAATGAYDAIDAIALHKCLTDSRFNDAGLDNSARNALTGWMQKHFAY